MRLISPGPVAGWIYPEALFRIKTDDKLLCLTFDDGPDPETTPRLIDILGRNNIRGLFFCTGAAAERYPDLLRLINSSGHIVGNHGFNHYDGWKTSTSEYLADAGRADTFTSPELFRPPFGRMTLRQYRVLKGKYKIVLWDIMAYDFDPLFGAERSLMILKKKIRRGSIIVLHDKPSSCAVDILQEFLDFAAEKGYQFIIPHLLSTGLKEISNLFYG